ncbi:MAG: PQQ-dependent sugar dehydrogenase [Nitrososphaeraceae archaeon]
MPIISSIKLYFYFLILAVITIFLIEHSYQQTVTALIPKPGTLHLLNDTSVILPDPSFKIEVFAKGLKTPTNMAFLDSGDALVLEKQNGKVRKIVNGGLVPKPLLDVNVANFDTRGMLGIAVIKNETRGVEYVFLYFTQAGEGLGDGEDICKKVSNCIDGGINQPSGNVLYRYELSKDEKALINKKLLLNFSALPGATHNGGEIVVGPDNNIYLITGNAENRTTLVSNSKKNPNLDGKAGILALDHDGRPAFTNGILGSNEPLNKYYAYGIRNGFGLDFDPITGKLWDTENGPEYGDEINLVEPGFNSGVRKIMGFWTKSSSGQLVIIKGVDNYDGATLVNFNGKGKYSSPELAWNQTIAPTAIKFLNSNKYGKEYQNDVLVGSNIGYVFHFNLKPNRTELDLKGPLKDRIANNRTDELTDNTFGKGFGSISDITVGPDGYLYIVSLTRGENYRIIPSN